MVRRICKICLIRFRRKSWKKNNKHNDTVVNSIFPLESVNVGVGSYGKLNMVWMAKNANVSIGNYCSIGPEVKFLVGGEHDYKRISTYPFQTLVYEQKCKNDINRNICIEDDVWIGYDSLILSGVTIGQGSVIGARSVVAKDIPPYSIYVGNKIIGQRFSKKIIEELVKLDYSTIKHQKNDSYQYFCQQQVDEENIKAIIDTFSKN